MSGKIDELVQEFLGPEIAIPAEPVTAYTSDPATVAGDMQTCRDMAEGTAVVLIHNLPGTPILNFSVYGSGTAYAAALELVEGFTRACSERQAKEVQS